MCVCVCGEGGSDKERFQLHLLMFLFFNFYKGRAGKCVWFEGKIKVGKLKEKKTTKVVFKNDKSKKTVFKGGKRERESTILTSRLTVHSVEVDR